MKWPAKSPDLNPFEDLSGLLVPGWPTLTLWLTCKCRLMKSIPSHSSVLPAWRRDAQQFWLCVVLFVKLIHYSVVSAPCLFKFYSSNLINDTKNKLSGNDREDLTNFHGFSVHTQLCCSINKYIFFTNVAPFKMFSNWIRFVAKRHSYNKEIIKHIFP